MKNIILFGAGRSSSSLIQYLSGLPENIALTVADARKPSWLSLTGRHIFREADIQNEAQRLELIRQADLVISLLPPALHPLVAKDCVSAGKHFLTASYVSPEIEALSKTASEKKILLLMECGLDPGIDHMSAMKEIEDIRNKGGEITSFRSYTGGLVAPESDNNPWHYKITWNPRNVVLAGQGTVKYLHKGQYKYIPYHRLFTSTEKISVDGYGNFEGYANRDSLKYIGTYGLENVQTFLRGTLRRPGFCNAWNLLVQLGITDDSFILENSEELTYRDFTLSFLREKKEKKTGNLLAALIDKGPGAQEIACLKWLGLLDEKKTGLPQATPAMILQKLLEEKLLMKSEDKDMIVMQHIFDYTLQNKKLRRLSSLVITGENNLYTAMAKTVGLPLGIAAKLILENKITLHGLQIPVKKEIYEPILEELGKAGVKFINKDS